ncbi:MAG: hypothetical protein IPG96_11710 [Proteobacteria bacterium]|nr:hypothetical protein [Pseudomonadota bacterium]
MMRSPNSSVLTRSKLTGTEQIVCTVRRGRRARPRRAAAALRGLGAKKKCASALSSRRSRRRRALRFCQSGGV